MGAFNLGRKRCSFSPRCNDAECDQAEIPSPEDEGRERRREEGTHSVWRRNGSRRSQRHRTNFLPLELKKLHLNASNTAGLFVGLKMMQKKKKVERRMGQFDLESCFSEMRLYKIKVSFVNNYINITTSLKVIDKAINTPDGFHFSLSDKQITERTFLPDLQI